jgi:secondary thiamine-phosphate synthase enzyme
MIECFMTVFSKKKEYSTKAHMSMIDISDDFRDAVRESGLQDGIITGFTLGGVAAITTLEFEPGVVKFDLKNALDVISPYKDKNGNVIPYEHHKTWNDDNGSSHIKSALLSPSVTVPFIEGKLTLGPWQNLTLVECDTRDRNREVVFQVIGE